MGRGAVVRARGWQNLKVLIGARLVGARSLGRGESRAHASPRLRSRRCIMSSLGALGSSRAGLGLLLGPGARPRVPVRSLQSAMETDPAP
ncbi:hypothetical protein GW7_18719 [Heterocephalus glaber]|uniref:Uncharacterized protein n=1 Tax=Heterocephalus glaber TaxID=10181 RepID=G5BLZ7_HETGA|nr:hypothetical protein GW7_18719 [Heterocephalus glaber]